MSADDRSHAFAIADTRRSGIDFDWERVQFPPFLPPVTEERTVRLHDPDNDRREPVGDTGALPYKAVCKLIMQAPNGFLLHGTGWLTAPDKLYTAGHNVYAGAFGGWMEWIVVIPACSGRWEPFGRFRALQMMADENYIADEALERYDIGAIKLEVPVGHGDYIRPVLDSPASGRVVGYPWDRDDGTVPYQMEGAVSKSGGQFLYDIDTSTGQSGGPLLKNDAEAVGIHNHGGGGRANRASAFYPEFIDDVDAW